MNVDSDVRIDGSDAIVRADGAETRVTLPAQFFTVDGYAPFAAQMLLLRYWQAHGQPRVLKTVPGLPVNDVVIEPRGRDAIRVGDTVVRLERYAIDGVVWGKETVWLDERGSLAAAITRAGGLASKRCARIWSRRSAGSSSAARAIGSPISRRSPGRCRCSRAAPTRWSARRSSTARDARRSQDGVVLVRDGRIADAGARADVTMPPEVAIVDVRGKTIVPGLWDMHTHVTQVEWAPVYLAAGVTTVRDMGNEFDFITPLRDAIDVGARARPEAAARGPHRRRRTERLRHHLRGERGRSQAGCRASTTTPGTSRSRSTASSRRRSSTRSAARRTGSA